MQQSQNLIKRLQRRYPLSLYRQLPNSQLVLVDDTLSEDDFKRFHGIRVDHPFSNTQKLNIISWNETYNEEDVQHLWTLYAKSLHSIPATTTHTPKKRSRVLQFPLYEAYMRRWLANRNFTFVEKKHVADTSLRDIFKDPTLSSERYNWYIYLFKTTDTIDVVPSQLTLRDKETTTVVVKAGQPIETIKSSNMNLLNGLKARINDMLQYVSEETDASRLREADNYIRQYIEQYVLTLYNHRLAVDDNVVRVVKDAYSKGEDISVTLARIIAHQAGIQHYSIQEEEDDVFGI